MATITETVEEFLPTSLPKQITLQKTAMNFPTKTKSGLPPQTLGCPPDCACKKNASYKPSFFTAIGILVALLAAYMIVSTNSNVYLVFWVCYSILRRLSKSKVHSKQD